MGGRILGYVRRHHLALIALFIALGGTSVAATQLVLPRNSVGTRQLKNGAVTKKKIARQTLTGLKGARGPTGAQGLPGTNGAKGVAGTTTPSQFHIAPGVTTQNLFNFAAPNGDFSSAEGQMVYWNANREITVVFHGVANDHTGRCQFDGSAFPATGGLKVPG